MSNEETIREFFSKKPGYLRTGAKKVADLLEITDYKLVKKIKKELTASGNFEGNLVMPNPIIKNIDITPELLVALKEALESGALASVEPESIIKVRQPKDKKNFLTPGIHLLMGCNHVPFHNKVLHEGIRGLIKDLDTKMVGFHIMGDFMDINTLSFHDKGKFTAIKGLTLEAEYKACAEEFEAFDNVLPETVVDKSFLYGNHEDRVCRFNKDMQNAKNPAILPHEAVDFRARGYAVHTKWSEDYITLGKKLDLFHGIYFNLHNAKKHLDVFKRSSAYVHTHRSQMYREGVEASHNIGSCADFSSQAFGYATRAMKEAWCNGFALVHIDENGDYFFSQIDVKDSKFYYNGKKY